MSYRTRLVPAARAEIRALPAYVRAEALDVLEELTRNPRPHRAKELRGKPEIYRIWLAGRWWMAYEVDDEDERIYVLRVRRKERIDYETLSSVIHEDSVPYDADRAKAGGGLAEVGSGGLHGGRPDVSH